MGSGSRGRPAVRRPCLIRPLCYPRQASHISHRLPNLKKDLAIFDELPPKVCGAFEFCHASWLDEEVFARLAARNLALRVR